MESLGFGFLTYMKRTHEIFHPRESKNWEGTYEEMQKAVKFTVQNPQDLKEILDLCEKMTSPFFRSPLLHTVLISFKEDKGIDTAAPQKLDSAFKIVITKDKNYQLGKYDVALMSNPFLSINHKFNTSVMK